MDSKTDREVEHLKDQELEDLSKDFPMNKCGVVRMQPQGWFLYTSYLKYADKLLHFKFRPSDVIVMTFPKCGTTWMQEIVWTMRNNASLNHPDTKQSINFRSPFIDCDFLDDKRIDKSPDSSFIDYFKDFCPEGDPEAGMFLQMAEKSPDPRTIKIHIPFSLLNPDLLDICKVVYVARDPKDTCVSYHHHHRLMKDTGYSGTWDQFVDYFISDSLLFSPFWTHIREAWDKRSHPNLLMCFYEEMKENPRKNICRLNNFLKTNLSEEEIDKVLDHTSFNSMKERDVLMGMPNEIPSFMDPQIYNNDGGFFRKGQTGDWKSKFTEEQEEKINDWTKKSLQGMDPEFPYLKTLRSD